MPKSRYSNTPVLGVGERYGTSVAISRIRDAINLGLLPYDITLLKGSQRLDVLAGEIYGESRYWWILAAASDIGWGLQVPPGTVIKIPVLEKALKIVG